MGGNEVKTLDPQGRPQTWVIFGPSGGGKSTLSATAPKPAFLDTNDGLLSIAGRPGFEHVKGERITDFDGLERCYDNFTGTGRKNWKGKFGTAIVDHFDDVQAIIMEELGERRKARDDRKDIDESEQKDWGVMATKLKRILRKYKTLPMHKILICGEMESKEDGRMIPSLQGQLQGKLPYFADHIAYLRLGKNGRRFLHLDPSDRFLAKTRAWWLTPEQRKLQIKFDDTTTLTKLFDLIAAGPKGNTTNGDEE
jgi:hypothetical protein